MPVLLVIRLFVSVSVEFLDTRVSVAHVGSVSIPPDTVIAAILGVTRAGDPVLTNPQVPVEVAHQRVFTISHTVASSKTVAAAAVMVVLAGSDKVFMSTSTSESINAHAAVTLAVSVTSAKASIPHNFVSSAVVNHILLAVSDISSASRTTTPVCQFTESTALPPQVAVIVTVAPSLVGTPVIVVLLHATKLSTPALLAILVPPIRYSCP